METLASGIGLFSGIFVILISITIHEYAHAWMAYKYGDDTAKRMGRLTLNPFAHISMLGTVIMPLLVGIGWAKPIPVNLKSLTRKQVFRVAAAGPCANMLFALALAIAFHFFSLRGTGLGGIVALTAVLNLILATINLIPVPPADGSKMVTACMKNPAAAALYNRVGFFVLCFVIIPWVVFGNGFRVIVIPALLIAHHLFRLPLPGLFT